MHSLNVLWGLALYSASFLNFSMGKAHQGSSEQAKKNSSCYRIYKSENKMPTNFGYLHRHRKREFFFRMAFGMYMLKASLCYV